MKYFGKNVYYKQKLLCEYTMEELSDNLKNFGDNLATLSLAILTSKTNSPKIQQIIYRAVKDIKQTHPKVMLADPTLITTYDGQTILHFLAALRINKALKIFLKAGADVNIENSRGQTPLDIAISHDYKDTIKLLQHSGGKSNFYSILDVTPPRKDSEYIDPALCLMGDDESD